MAHVSEISICMTKKYSEYCGTCVNRTLVRWLADTTKNTKASQNIYTHPHGALNIPAQAGLILNLHHTYPLEGRKDEFSVSLSPSTALGS
jgi:hypothetical protein